MTLLYFNLDLSSRITIVKQNTYFLLISDNFLDYCHYAYTQGYALDSAESSI